MDLSWFLVLALSVALIGGAGVVWVKRRQGLTWIAALQAGVEFAIGQLARQGLPQQANDVGRTVGDAIAAAGPKIKALNDALLVETKVTVAAAQPSRKGTRELIADAFRAQVRPEGRPHG